MALVHLLLVAAGLLVFLPDPPMALRRKELRRLIDKYGKYVLAVVAVLVLYLLVVQVDDDVSAKLGWDFAPDLARLEGGFVPGLAALWNPGLDLLFSVVFLVLHPFMLYFPILLFVLSDEERPAKAMMLLFPLAYLLALPFYLLFPAQHVYIHHAVQSPLFRTFPEMAETYFNATTSDNSFPSLHVAYAVLVANAARFSRQRQYRLFAYGYAALLVAAVLYLNLDWLAGVLGGLLVAALVATFTGRFISTERLALQRVKPTPEEAQGVAVSAARLMERVREELAARRVDADVLLVGSAAKETYLRDSVDFDVFLLLPPTVPREDLERVGLEVGHAVLIDPEERYAEHPYVHGTYGVHEADVVPAYKIADPSERLTAVDRTPFHTRLVLERIQRDQRDQVRLLKAFMKGVGVYGAEAATRGFSGYLTELLVLKFGTFRGVLKAGAGWKPGTFLVLDRLEGTPRFADPLTFIDPVDPRRNVASAVSAETLAQFSEACRNYIRRESLSFFFPRQLVPQPPDELSITLRRRRGDFVLLRTRAPTGVLPDHLHDQMRKASVAIGRLLERHGFEVRRTTHEVGGELLLLVELLHLRLPDTVTHMGPPVRSREHAERFRKAWTGHRDARSPVYEEDGRLKVERVREHRRADELLRARLLEYDLGKHLTAALQEGFEILAGQDVVQEDTARLLTRHLNRRKSWDV